MFSLIAAKKTVNIVIEDYVIRMAESTGEKGLSTIKNLKEDVLPPGLIKDGKIIDDIQFYDFMKKLVQKWGIKHQHVRFYVPSSLVIMRPVECPAHIETDNLKEHFMMEIGETIHLPFQQPIIDIHVHASAKDSLLGDHRVEKGKKRGTLFAVPEEEVTKYTEIFADVSLKPIAADIRELGVYRYFHEIDQVDQGKSYLFFEVNLTSIHVSIFQHHALEFLRYQQLHVEAGAWHASVFEEKKLHWSYGGDQQQQIGTIEDQINELERIMDFYRYSLHKGEKMVTEIVILGDDPHIEIIYQKVKNQYSVPVKLLQSYQSNTKDKNVGTSFIPVIGLGLKGDK